MHCALCVSTHPSSFLLLRASNTPSGMHRRPLVSKLVTELRWTDHHVGLDQCCSTSLRSGETSPRSDAIASASQTLRAGYHDRFVPLAVLTPFRWQNLHSNFASPHIVKTVPKGKLFTPRSHTSPTYQYHHKHNHHEVTTQPVVQLPPLRPLLLAVLLPLTAVHKKNSSVPDFTIQRHTLTQPLPRPL